MSARSSNESGSWGRRKSVFALSSPSSRPANDANGYRAPPKTLKKTMHGRFASETTLPKIDHPDIPRASSDDLARSSPTLVDSTKPHRPSLSMKSSLRRPPSVFGSLRKPMRTSSEEIEVESPLEPLSATSTHVSQVGPAESTAELAPPVRTVVLHGEVQTSAGMFRKKKEYLVLTETHFIRYKSQARAAETFHTIPYPVGRSPTVRHTSSPSAGSQSDLQTLSDSSGDRDGRVPLRQVVAVHQLDDGKPYFAIEVCYLDEESGQALAMALQFNAPEERDVWLRNIRRTLRDARFRESGDISAFNLEHAARIIERDNDYDPDNCAIFKIVQRHNASKAPRSSSDDLSKIASVVCFLAIGVHKVHIIQLVKPVARTSSPSLSISDAQASHGILTLTAVRVSGSDDTFELTFRQPLQQQKTLYLASAQSYEIAVRLHFAENYLRPECGHRLFKFSAPKELDDLLAPPVSSNDDHSCLQRTMIAYCVAYGANPSNVRYKIEYECEDAPRFELLPPADTRRPAYGPLELLAIMRALRYNESFGSISLAGILLDSLNGLHDNYGQEYVCSRTKRGTPIRLTIEELGRSCLLVQEVRALAATSKKLRRMDFSRCITTKTLAPMSNFDDETSKTKDLGCGIVEALFPLCKHQTTNVDWICLSGIYLSDTDMDYLVGAAVDRSCHFRGLELNRCGLNDRSMGLILDALRAQDNTLEAIEIAGNGARLNPVTFDGQLAMFGFIRKLNLSYISRTSGDEPLLQAETLLIWRLQELRLSGTPLNRATVDSLGAYLAHPQSSTLRQLFVDNAFLTGRDLAVLLHSLVHDGNQGRDMHLDISQSHISKNLEHVTQAITAGIAPTHLSMRAVEYKEESMFRKMIAALTVNKTIKFLDISQTSLPGDASDDACRALERLLAENTSLITLNISGEDSRLATSKFGSGINQALNGLRQNKTLHTLFVEKQQLGLQGASTLAEVLKENNTLRELHCDNNEINLHGFTDLVNSLVENTTLLYLPTMEDGRAASFKSAELTMKVMSGLEAPASPQSPPAPSSFSSSTVKSRLASVRMSTARSVSAYSPSFPALPAYNRTPSSPDSRSSSPLTMSLPRPRARKDSQSPITAPVTFTVQDIHTTHRLLTEQWDRQCYRLAKYLERNWCLYHDIPVDMEIEDEKFERPESAGSIGKVLEKVKYETTPRAEKELYFEPQPERDSESAAEGSVTGWSDEKANTDSTRFLLDSAPQSPDSEFNEMTKSLRINTKVEELREPKTPTQANFTT